MSSKLHIMVCKNFEYELMSAIRSAGLEDVEAHTFPAICGNPKKRFDSCTSRRVGQQDSDETHILGGCCLSKIADEIDASNKFTTHKFDQCFYMVAPRTLVDSYLAKGAYLITPGWLSQWRRRLVTWGFDQNTARQFFGESIASLVLMDTGLPGSHEQIVEFAAFVGLPFQIVPLGLEYFQLFLEKIVHQWQMKVQKSNLAEANQQRAQFAMVYELVARLSEAKDEEKAVKDILELFSMLFAPQKLVYTPVYNSMPSAPNSGGQDNQGDDAIGDSTLLGSGEGFRLNICHKGEKVGIIEVDGIAFPEHVHSYLNLAGPMGKVCGLAISNARTYGKLKQRSDELKLEIIERKRSEAMLAIANRQNEMLLNSVGEGIYGLDLEGRTTFANPQAVILVGYTLEEMIGRSQHDLTHHTRADGSPYSREECPIYTAFKDGQVHSVDTEVFWRSDGTSFPVAYTSTPIRDENGELQGAVVVFSDITERKRVEAESARLEAENQQLQKAESLGRMAGAIAHIFNNQLSVVMGNLELALMDLPEDAAIRGELIQAMRAARRSADVSGLMLTYLGQSRGEPELLDLSEVCRKNLPMLQETMPEGIVLETDLLSPGPVVRAHENQMLQILTNLITNGCESIGHSTGRVTVTTRIIPASEVPKSHLMLFDWKPAEGVFSCLEVIDTGCGIAEDDIDKIFDPFFSTKFVGRGLGLAVVLGLVKTGGGAMGVESKKNQGSIFRVFLPLVTDELPRPSEKAAQAL